MSGYSLNPNYIEDFECKGEIVWKVYLSHNNYKKSGWYSLQDLNDWFNGIGKFFN